MHWQEPATVEVTFRALRQAIAMLRQVNAPPTYPALGPFPLTDTMGYAIAVAMVAV